MKIDLSQIDAEPLSINEVLVLAPEQVDTNQVVAPISVRLEGEVRPLGEGYAVSGRWVAEGPLTCSRCLEPVPWEVEERFSVEYRLPSTAPLDAELGLGEEDLDVVFLDGTELDLEELAAEQIVLALPIKIVCDQDCAGLCPRCGANRNREGACRCKPEIDPRWAALADLGGSEQSS